MKTVKQHAAYTIFQRRDGRHAVRAKHGKKGKSWLNGDDKVEVLAREGLITKPQPKTAPEPGENEASSKEEETSSGGDG